MAIDSGPKLNSAGMNNHTVSRPGRDETLRIVDNRTGHEYVAPIVHNSIPAMIFKQMEAPQNKASPCDQNEYGIRIYDPGFQNTCVSESKITYKYVVDVIT